MGVELFGLTIRNALIEAIQEFLDVPIFTEDTQTDKFPNIFISQAMMRETHDQYNTWIYSYLFEIRYRAFSDVTVPGLPIQRNLNNAGNLLMTRLNYINLGGKPFALTNEKRAEIDRGILYVFVPIDVPAYRRSLPAPKQEALTQTTKFRGWDE